MDLNFELAQTRTNQLNSKVGAMARKINQVWVGGLGLKIEYLLQYQYCYFGRCLDEFSRGLTINTWHKITRLARRTLADVESVIIITWSRYSSLNSRETERNIGKWKIENS